MKDQNTNTTFSQEVVEVRQNFIEQIHLVILEAMHHVLEEERTALCGPSHHPTPDSPYVRAGTTNSRAILNGKRVDIQRPRVRKIDPESGQSKEVDLVSWKAIKDDDSMREAAMRATLYGVSTRNIGKLTTKDQSTGTSRWDLSLCHLSAQVARGSSQRLSTEEFYSSQPSPRGSCLPGHMPICGHGSLDP